MYFDSGSEVFFNEWCNELIRYDIIESVENHPTFELISKKYIDKNVLKRKKPAKLFYMIEDSLEYTPDFKIVWKKECKRLYQNIDNLWFKPSIFFSQIIDGKEISFVEVKETNQHGNITASVIKQKILYDKLGIYVNMVKPFVGAKALFRTTFQPASLNMYKLNNKEERKKMFRDWKEAKIEDFIKELETMEIK